MWEPPKYHTAMDPSQLARPWTPPETEAQSSPRSDYFSDSFRGGDSAYSSYTEHRWPPNRLDELANTSPRCDTPTEDHRLRPKPIATHTAPAPYTPTKTLSLDEAHGAPRYPYTPDSSRIPRRNTEIPGSPTPWDDYSDHSSSPVQNALSSCIAHFENLIQTRQPDEDQMEYIVGQFEAMASYLSAPESQTRKTDEHLFDEQEAAGLGISSPSDAHNTDFQAQPAHVSNEYVAEVGRYISGVKKYIEDLKMRLDEVKTLNSIQLDVIHDLRRQMKTVRQGMRSSLSMREEYEKADESAITPQHPSDNIPAYEDANDTPAHANEQDQSFGRPSWETINTDDDHGDFDDFDDISPLPPQSQAPSAKNINMTELRTSHMPPGYKLITIIRTPHRRSFWASLAEALDAVGELLLEDQS